MTYLKNRPSQEKKTRLRMRKEKIVTLVTKKHSDLLTVPTIVDKKKRKNT